MDNSQDIKPVAWRRPASEGEYDFIGHPPNYLPNSWSPLYDHPPAAQPLPAGGADADDTQRLDWMFSAQAYVVWDQEGEQCRAFNCVPRSEEGNDGPLTDWCNSGREAIDAARGKTARSRLSRGEGRDGGDNHKLDTDEQVFFYEQDFYVLSNFSSFTLQWHGIRFDTSEAAYHWMKFHNLPEVQELIRMAPSAHEAFKIAEKNKAGRRSDWDYVKLGIMQDILHAKAEQHEYVRRKLLATGTRQLVEDSWRDDYWGWGPNKDGQNWLGRLWMMVRMELNAALAADAAQGKGQ